MTGHIKFDHTGKRTDFALDLIELTSEGPRKVCVHQVALMYTDL